MRDFYVMDHAFSDEPIELNTTLYFSSYLAAAQEVAKRVLRYINFMIGTTESVYHAQYIMEEIRRGNYATAMEKFNLAQTIHTFKIEKISIDTSEFSFGNVKEHLFQEADYKISQLVERLSLNLEEG